jgi:tetratricopeptide (TPR) repeat protein
MDGKREKIMDFQTHMQQITAGLTGDSEKDMKYLQEQAEKYRGTELSTEIERAIDRLIYDLLPEEARNKIEQLSENDVKGIESVMHEAQFQMESGNIQKAIDLLEPIISTVGMLFQDDDESEYRDFNNVVENVLYVNLYSPKKNVLLPIINRSTLYLMYGYGLVELKRFDDAKMALEIAIKYNPINTAALFEYAELFKINKNFQRFLKWTRRCLQCAYHPEDIARAYRNFGYYYIEQGQFDTAATMYYVSLFYEQNKQATSELFYITQMTGKKTDEPSPEKAQQVFSDEDIQYGANDFVISILVKLAENAEEHKSINMAKHYYTMLYKLNGDESVKEKLDQLSKAEISQ